MPDLPEVFFLTLADLKMIVTTNKQNHEMKTKHKIPLLKRTYFILKESMGQN